MKRIIAALLFTSPVFAQSPKFVTSDIDRFWKAYDKIRSVKDSAQQYQYLNDIYLSKATPGLTALMQEREYTAQSYIEAINSYPLFWNSVRANTYKSGTFAKDIEKEIVKFKQLYPALRPAAMYFTIGAMRTGGTTLGNLVLIGAEMAMTDQHTVTSEFPSPMKEGRRAFFNTNPIKDFVLLNVHEYVHTQQVAAVNNLLSYVVREGIAEFVSVKVTGKPSATPAVPYGQSHAEAVRRKFEQQLFSIHAIRYWLWSDAPNEFNTRDLGYYVGYAMAEKYYNKARDKKKAIKEMIELDFNSEDALGHYVDSTGYLSGTLSQLYTGFEASRPYVTGIREFTNNSSEVNPALTTITLTFSGKMDTRYRSTGFGPLGQEHAPKVAAISQAEDGLSVTYTVKLEPGKHYQLTLENGYRSVDAIQMKPYMIDFVTQKHTGLR